MRSRQQTFRRVRSSETGGNLTRDTAVTCVLTTRTPLSPCALEVLEVLRFMDSELNLLMRTVRDG